LDSVPKARACPFVEHEGRADSLLGAIVAESIATIRSER
jgi:hypothetical protein